MSCESRVGDLRLFGLVPARYECGSAAFRAESLWLSVELLQSEAMPLRRSLDTNQILRNAAEPPEVSPREGTFGFGMLTIELCTLDFGHGLCLFD